MGARVAMTWLAAAAFLAVGGAPAVAEEPGSNPFAAAALIDEVELDGLRGGDDTIIDSFNTTITVSATNDVTASIGTMTIEVGGNIHGGNVSFSDNALQSMHGMLTQAIATAPGAIVTATSALSVNLLD
jgi:hypothetical protein